MSTSAFGVDHGDISKADEYRDSKLAAFNPRSKTKVKRGTGLKRVGGPVAGSVGGTILGTVAGAATKNPTVTRYAGQLGGYSGQSAMLTRNIKSGDTVSTNKKTGKTAKAKLATPVGTYNIF